MSVQQPIKPRVIKTTVQKEKPPEIDEAMLHNQYTAIINNQKLIIEMLNYIISQPQKPLQKVSLGAKPLVREIPPTGNIEPVKSAPIWQQTDKERLAKAKPEELKRKTGKGLVISMVVFAILIILAAYLYWSASHGYVFFWNAK